MHLYERSSKADLTRFAANRAIQVRSTGKFPTRPTKRDFQRALKIADAARTFDFLELPPELRTKIYRDLLVLNDSFTCHPNILRTCKLINSEATGILYGDNLFEVKVFRGGVYAHGMRCGDYAFDYADRHPRGQKKGQKLEWPHFLRKAQFIQFSVEVYKEPLRQLMYWVPRMGALHFIVYSLCSFLETNRSLRSFVVRLSQLQDLFDMHLAIRRYEDGVTSVLYPLRLLSSVKDLRVEGISGDLAAILTPSNITIETADKILAGDTWPLMKQIQLVEATIMSIKTGSPFERLTNSVAWMMSSILLLLEGTRITTGLGHMFVSEMKSLREEWDAQRTDQMTEKQKRQLEQLVQVEVEVKLGLSQ